MLRRLMCLIHKCSQTLHDAAFAVRRWMSDWLFFLIIPFRAIRPRNWAGLFANGATEVLLMLRLVRPREFGTELVGGGREAAGLVRRFFGGVVATVVAFFWLLFWLPWHLIRFGYYGPRRAYYFLRSRTRLQIAYILSAALVVVVGGGGPAYYLLKEHRRTFRISILQRNYDGYLIYNNNLEKLESSLAELAAAMPDDVAVARRLAMVRSQEIPASEPKLVRFFMRYHSTHGQPTESVREAEKLLENSPDDWEAHLFLAKAALARGDREAAKRYVADLPKADDAAESILPYPGVARDSIILFHELGLQARLEDMLEFLTLRILPDLRSREMVHLSIPHKLFLIDCYYVALSRLDKRPKLLLSYWVPLEMAYQSIMDDPATDPKTLLLCGQRGQKDSWNWLKVFLNMRLVSQDEYETMARDLVDRLLRLWNEVILRDPKLPGGYVNKAELLYNCNRPALAEQVLAEGFKQCGNDSELVIATGKLLQLTDPRRGLAFFEQTVGPETMNPILCSVLAELAAAADRWDKAIDACERALKLDPKLEWPRLRLAALYLRLERPADAVNALKPIRAGLAKYPEACADYVRALCECGLDQEADEFMGRVTAADVSVIVLVKTALALQAAGRNGDALRLAARARKGTAQRRRPHGLRR